MGQFQIDTTTKSGTAAGTLLTIFANIKSEDLIKTGILAAVGALVSFAVTLALKSIVKRLKN
jgi:hypothetical protein